LIRYGSSLYTAFLFRSIAYFGLPNFDSMVTVGYWDAILGKIRSTTSF
jgi:hypothetical protein